MTLVSQIITDAYRETNLIGVGKEPNANQQTEALRRLKRAIGAVYGSDAGENLQPWPLGNYGRNANFNVPDPNFLIYPVINSRLVATAEEAKTLYLPVNPSDGARIGIVDPFARLAAYPVTLDANGRTIETAATLLLNTNSLNRVWFYRADIGNWVRITDIIAGDEMPFPEEFDDYFTIRLAMRLNPSYGKNIAPETLAVFKEARQRFVARYLQSAPLEANNDLSFPLKQSYDNFSGNFGFTSTQDFNRGWPGP